MSSSENYSPEQIEEWSKRLEQLAEQAPTAYTKRDAVEAMIEPILKALEKHSYETVAASMKGWGLDIAPGSLKQYVSGWRRKKQQEKSSVKRKKSVEAKIEPVMPVELKKQKTVKETSKAADEKPATLPESSSKSSSLAYQ